MRLDRPALLFGILLSMAIIRATHADAQPAPAPVDEIKAYCIDFNWAPGGRRHKPFASPGRWSEAEPAAHVAWYKAVGANVLQTFCVSCNGYAWYKDGFIPEQPGLKHDFLREVVGLGHEQKMLVMGYFCVGANTKWGTDHPDLSYGTPTTYHIPYTDEYLDYLEKSITDAVGTTGIDGFMFDWLWMPRRQSTQGKWLDCEKKLYEQLMNEPFPGEELLTKEQDTAYSRRALDSCWKTIRDAARKANPRCILWLTCNNVKHPHVVHSDMFKEVDWLMNEAGDMRGIDAVRSMVGEHTRLITCLALWNGQDAIKVVPEAIKAGVGLYGFTAPGADSGLVPLERFMAKPVSELKGDERSISVLARAYHGASVEALWKDGRFIEPTPEPQH